MFRKLSVASLSLLPMAAFAAPVDVSALKTTIEDTLTPIGTIGLAVLGIVVGVKVFRWIRGAL